MLVRTNIYLPKEIINFLKLKAEEEKVAMAEVIREILAKEMNKQRDADWTKSLIKLAKKAGKSGLKDLSQRHDYYLYIEPYLKKQKKRKK